MTDSKVRAKLYRGRAEHMLVMAARTGSPELRAGYLELATNWSQLAELAEKAPLRGGIAAGQDEAPAEDGAVVPAAALSAIAKEKTAE